MQRSDIKPTRFLSALYLKNIADFFTYSVHKYGLSIDEVAIICLIAAENTRVLLDDSNALNHFGFEQRVLPDAQRSPVTLKFVYTSLGLNRETARRRLNRLVEQKFILKKDGGFLFPQQSDETDYTRELRDIVANRLDDVITRVDRMRIER